MLFRQESQLAKRAANLPYASLLVQLDGQKLLLVMAYTAQQQAWFLSSNQVNLKLKQGYLNQLTGTPASLLMTQLSQDGHRLDAPWRSAKAGQPMHYQLVREWRLADASLHADRADATLLCSDQVETVKLAVSSRALATCTETLVWSDGSQTRSTLWRDANSKRLWRVHTQAWPGAPIISWQVAKPWW